MSSAPAYAKSCLLLFRELRIDLSVVPKPGGLGQRWGAVSTLPVLVNTLSLFKF